MVDRIEYIHPGEILKEEFLEPMKITASKLASLIGVDRMRTYKICKGERDLTPDTALRLAKLFGNSPDFWLGLQSNYDLAKAKSEMSKQVMDKIKPLEYV